jgi:hypothetical protein
VKPTRLASAAKCYMDESYLASFAPYPHGKLEKLARWRSISQLAAVFRKRFAAYNYREKVGPKSLRMHQRLVEICKRMFEAGGVCELSSPV